MVVSPPTSGLLLMCFMDEQAFFLSGLFIGY